MGGRTHTHWQQALEISRGKTETRMALMVVMPGVARVAEGRVARPGASPQSPLGLGRLGCTELLLPIASPGTVEGGILRQRGLARA